MKGYKVIRKDMTHNGFKYQRGLNVDIKPFRRTGSCVEGGLYFFTDLKDLPEWLGYGDHLWEVQVPEGAQCVQDPEGDKYRADKLVLVKRHKLASKNIWKQIAKHVYGHAIHAASYYGHLGIVKELIGYKAPVDELTMYWAARHGHLEIVRELIGYKAPVDERAIYWAARHGHLEIVRELIGYKAPVDERAIYWAAQGGHLDIVKELIKYKAPVHEYAIRAAKTEEIKELLTEYSKVRG